MKAVTDNGSSSILRRPPSLRGFFFLSQVTVTASTLFEKNKEKSESRMNSTSSCFLGDIKTRLVHLDVEIRSQVGGFGCDELVLYGIRELA